MHKTTDFQNKRIPGGGGNKEGTMPGGKDGRGGGTAGVLASVDVWLKPFGPTGHGPSTSDSVFPFTEFGFTFSLVFSLRATEHRLTLDIISATQNTKG